MPPPYSWRPHRWPGQKPLLWNQKRWGFYGSHVYTLWQDLSRDTKSYGFKNLTLKFHILLNNFNQLILAITFKLKRYYTLRSSLQILRSAVLDDGTSHPGDLKSGSVLSRGSIILKRPQVFECIHVSGVLKYTTRMIRLYTTSTVPKDLNNANCIL